MPISRQVPDKQLPLDNPIKEHTASDPASASNPGFDPASDSDLEFDPGFHSDSEFDPDPDSNSNPGYDSGYETDSDSKFVPEKRTLTLSRSAKSNVDFDFENWIETMRERADQKRNITWRLSGRELTREVNHSKDCRRLYASEDYVIQGLNICRAANKICSLYGQDGSEFSKSARKFVNYYYAYLGKPEKLEDFWIKTIKKINKWVVLRLQTKVFKDEKLNSINEKLRLAENYVGLDDVHYNVTTTFTIGDTKFALEDKKAFPLTVKQKQAYLNRQSEPWYQRLTSFEQRFIDAYVAKLSDSNHYLPTQLRSLPGCRNAYQKRVLAYDKYNNETVLGYYYHSGSMASPIEWKDKATDFQITKDNWDQVTSQDKNVEVISLNYNMDLPGFKQIREKKIVEDTKKVVGDDKFMNVSINGIGTSCNLEGQVNKLVNESLDSYKDRCPKLGKTFRKKNKKDRDKQIEKIKDQKDKSFFKQLVALEKAAATSRAWNNWKQTTHIMGNPNATIAANYIACKSVLGQTANTSSVLFSCKSGKDRTGLMSYLVDGNIISMHYPSLDLPNESIYARLAWSRHYQLLSSLNAGMTGRFGMKFVKANEIIRKFTKLLFPETARLTYIGLDKEQPGQLEEEEI